YNKYFSKSINESINEKTDLNRSNRKGNVQDDDFINKILLKLFGKDSTKKLKEYIAFS
ncbi:28301_t:CDS:1, partial [Racocetra persica]